MNQDELFRLTSDERAEYLNSLSQEQKAAFFESIGRGNTLRFLTGQQPMQEGEECEDNLQIPDYPVEALDNDNALVRYLRRFFNNLIP